MKSLALIFPLLLASAAQAQTCPGAPAGWESGTNLSSATAPATLDRARLSIGEGASVSLHPVTHVRFSATPERAPKDFGGMVSVTVSETGIYKIGLSSGAWIDVLKDSKPIASSTHGHGPACIRKMVSFPLTPGAHVIQLSGNAEPMLRIMVYP